MARLIEEGNLKVHYLTTVADISAPTEGEIEAGIHLTPFLVRGSLNRPAGGQTAGAADVDSAYNKTQAGTFGSDMSAQFYRDDDADTAWDTLPRLTVGFIVVAPYGYGGTTLSDPVGGEAVEVYPIEVADRSPNAAAENETQKFAVTFAVTDEPDQDAVVAAGS